MISDWSDLQTILSISRAGTLSAAARELGLSQSTMSRRLQAIERRLDERIFVRRDDGTLVPTTSASALIAAAKKMQSIFVDTQSTLRAADTPVRIATCEVIAKALLNSPLSEWLGQAEASVELSVHDDLFSLADDSFDVLVTPLESAPDDMVGQRIASLKWGLFAAPDYLAARPLQPDATDLEGCRVIRSSGSLADVAACRWFNSLGGQPTLSASSPAAQQDAAAAAAGIALLPEILAQGDRRLVQIDFPGAPSSDVWMVTRRSTAMQPRVATFLKWSRRHFARQRSATAQPPTSAGTKLQADTAPVDA